MHPTNTIARITLAALAGAALAGCQSRQSDFANIEWNDDARRDTNAWMLRTYQGQQVENAITRQHTIWSHHFVQGTTSLTPRAQRDLGVLASHYIKHEGGVLTVRQGGADDDLFAARLAVINDWLADAGVALHTLTVSHDLYTGDGKRSTLTAEDYVRPGDDSPYRFHDGQ